MMSAGIDFDVDRKARLATRFDEPLARLGRRPVVLLADQDQHGRERLIRPEETYRRAEPVTFLACRRPAAVTCRATRIERECCGKAIALRARECIVSLGLRHHRCENGPAAMRIAHETDALTIHVG